MNQADRRSAAATAVPDPELSVSPGALAWVVLACDELDGGARAVEAVELELRLLAHACSVARVTVPRHASRREATRLVRSAADGLAGPLPVLFAGMGGAAGVAVRATAGVDAAGLLSVDGSLLSSFWRLPSLQSPTMLVRTGHAGSPGLAMRLSKVGLGSKGRLVSVAGDQALSGRMIREWRQAAENGDWDRNRRSLARRLALPVAGAALLATPGMAAASPLTGHTVAASQRGGDGITAKKAGAAGKHLGGKKLKAGQRHGDALRPHATGSKGLTDAAGFKWFVNTNINFVTSSSASGAASSASYQHSTTASTLNGGTTSASLSNAYGGYNGIFVDVNGAHVGRCTGTGVTGCVSFNENGPATLACNNRVVQLPTQVIGGIDVSRQVYVPTDDHFSRWMNYFTNPGGSPATVQLDTSNNLGSGSNTKITGTSAGGTTPSLADNWITSFRNWSGTTSSDPRLGHVLQGPGGAVRADNLSFVDGNPNPTWGYTFTVQPGQTVAIANFGVADATIAASQADSARLDNLPPTALECLTPTEQGEIANFAVDQGYRLVGSDGGVFAFGQASFQGSLPADSVHVNDIVGMTSSPSRQGYTQVGSDGGVFAFGDAVFHGSLPQLGVSVSNIVGIARNADGGGYWMVGSDGGVFAFGDAGFFGSLPGSAVHVDNIVSMVPTADGQGYWMVGSDGGIFAFGDANFHGSLPGLSVSVDNIVGMAATPSGGGYYLVGADGGVFAFGDAVYHGSANTLPLSAPITGVTATAGGGGYWLAGADGGVFAYGDAPFEGSLPGLGAGVTDITGITT